ncbi:hypothetical protein [Streptomyces sp. NBC_00566]|uniref:hypothetical protein n=1 Tax=Streptomyces sp. NBC_00566 TaxID=2975778 RepID=UPI002E81C60B|nr:hypothetical protein [Streptomyces sp. NBC_00566]WUB88260.1 hypothetical protein OG812_17425 [Streptomyces sp. NBC_00566]
MAARKPDETPAAPTPEQPPVAAVRTQEYSAGTGWEVGQTAPDDAFRALDAAGTGEPTGPVVHKHPGGYARQIVAKGALITEGVRRELDDAERENEQG